MTPESHSLTGTDDPTPGPPPGCPAHGIGHRRTAPALRPRGGGPGSRVRETARGTRLGGPRPAPRRRAVWVVLGHGENLHMVRTPSQFCRDTRLLDAPCGTARSSPTTRSCRTSPGSPSAPTPRATSTCGCAARSPAPCRPSTTGASAATSTARPSTSSTSSARTGSADLVGQFAEHLPMAVMCEILGMPEEYNDRLVQAARDMLKGTRDRDRQPRLRHGGPGPAHRPPPGPARGGLHQPPHHAPGRGSPTTRSGSTCAWCSSPPTRPPPTSSPTCCAWCSPIRGFRAQLNGGQMTVPEAVEQSLWDEPPFSTVFAYFAKQETELGGQRIRKGDGLLLGIGAGQRRPARPSRPQGQHAGQPLAPRLRRRPPRVPGPGHRPRHRRRRRRRAADAAAGHPTRLRRGRAAAGGSPSPTGIWWNCP